MKTMLRLTKHLCTLLAAALSMNLAACSVNNAESADNSDKTPLNTPQLMATTEIRTSSVRLNWRPVENAAVYLCVLDDGLEQRFARTTYETTCRITGLTPDHTYTASVQAIAYLGSEYADSDAATTTVTTAAPEISDDGNNPQQVPDGYYLEWSDEFDGNALNEEDWNIEVNGDGGGNAELQYYRRENVTVKDGCLILTAKRESYQGKEFTSGRINTAKKQAFTYGRFDARIKMPKTKNGLWPAYWLMGNDYAEVGWPRCGEIDIVEMGNAEGISKNTQERFFNGAAHWGFYNQQNQYPNYAKSSTWEYSLQDGDFHLFSCVWDENSIKMYVDLDIYPDSQPYYEIGIGTDSSNPEWETARYFRHDFFVLFDLAVGGRFTGILNNNGITAELPAQMEVDYVRVYKKL